MNERSKELLKYLTGTEPVAFFYSGRTDDSNIRSYLFANPVKNIICKDPAGVDKALTDIQRFADRCYYGAGYISYETGYALEKKFRNFKPDINFGIYKTQKVYTLKEAQDAMNALPENVWISNLRVNTDKKEYINSVKEIKKNIRDGEVYQINYCFKYKYDFFGDYCSLFKILNTGQRVSYSAFIRSDNHCVISLSPELFYRVKGREIIMKPMKGTVIKNQNSKHKTQKEKNRAIRELKNEKNRAENIMIVDLIRNDLGRICETKSVRVPEVFETEEYETVYQMTSTVKGTLKHGAGFKDIISAVFPSGSVTGTPKIRAMELIREFEKEPRGVYTGAVGFTSKKESVFNIPIRTAVIKGNKGELGIGSGIVNDSAANNEYDECMGKAKFFSDTALKYSLFESLLYEKGKYFLKAYHMERLFESVKRLNIKLTKSKVLNLLSKEAKKLNRNKSYKVRLTVTGSGECNIDTVEIKEKWGGRLAISDKKVNSKSLHLKLKTTKREMYNSEYEKYKKLGYNDVIFMNERYEITEGHTSNIFIKTGKYYYTPPLKCGLLAGTYRRHLLKRKNYKEKVIHADDLINAEKIYLCNSVRGMAEFVL